MNKLVLLIALGLLARPLSGQPVTDGTRDSVRLTMADFRYHQPSLANTNGFGERIRTHPGLALLASAAIPGSGQAFQGNWIRAGAYLLADLLLLGVHFNRLEDARRRERAYKRFANNNWSVVTYAQWLVAYHDQNNISNPHLDELRQQVSGLDPTYDPAVDWAAIDLNLLNSVEQSTPFIQPGGTVTNNFSHTLPSFGSQQYYELISKYFQFGPGWNDFGINRSGTMLDNLFQLNWDGSDMPPSFFDGAERAENFNSSYRVAGNMISLLLVNHVVSAFDAYLTAKLNIRRLETETNLLGSRQLLVRYHF